MHFSRDFIIGIINRCPLFAGKNEDEIDSILNCTPHSINRYGKSSYIVQTQGKMPLLHIILSGTVEIHRPLMTGNTLCIDTRTTGDMFGGAVILGGENEGYPCNVLASEPVWLLQIHRRDLLNLLLIDGDISRNLYSIFSHRVYDANTKIELLSYSAINRKIAYYLTVMTQADQSGAVTLPFTKTKWAEFLNVSRPSLMRELKVLSEEGYISIKGRTVEIRNRDKLDNLLLF